MTLHADKITKKFPRKLHSSNFFYALEETNFTLSQGELVVVKGRSGSGKTTFLNILGGLLQPSSGKITLDGQDLYALDDRKASLLRNRHIAVIPQGAGAIYTLNVTDNILLPVLLYGKRTEESVRKARALMERFGIAELSDAMPSELSGGELRRMAIARAMINDATFLLADEPTGDLDDENTEAVLDLLRDAANNGKGILIISHDEQTLRYADRLFRMDGGRLTDTDPIQKFSR